MPYAGDMQAEIDRCRYPLEFEFKQGVIKVHVMVRHLTNELTAQPLAAVAQRRKAARRRYAGFRCAVVVIVRMWACIVECVKHGQIEIGILQRAEHQR